MHTHLAYSHRPWPEQLPTQSVGTSQAAPLYPGSQWQRPLRQTPCVEQLFVQSSVTSHRKPV